MHGANVAIMSCMFYLMGGTFFLIRFFFSLSLLDVYSFRAKTSRLISGTGSAIHEEKLQLMAVALA